jgi:hypothetical protein
METLNVLQAVATQAGRQVRAWRTHGLPGRTHDVLELVEHLAVAAAAAADTSLVEFQLLRAQLAELRARIGALEGKNSCAASTGTLAVLMLSPLAAAQAASTPNA